MNCPACNESAIWHVGLDRLSKRFTTRIVVSHGSASSAIKESRFGVSSGPYCYRHAVMLAERLNDQFGIQEDY